MGIGLHGEHPKRNNLSQDALIISIAQLKAETDKLKARSRDIEKEHGDIAGNTETRHVRGGKRSHMWFTPEVDGATYGSSHTRLSAVDNENPEPILQKGYDKFSVTGILQQLGSAFMPVDPTGGIDSSRMSASVFPWKMFKY